MNTSREARSSLAMAALLAVVLPHIPYLCYVMLPITYLVTCFHEMGHALMAWATGAEVDRIQMFLDGSGVTWSRGGNQLLIAGAGYLGSTVTGCLMLLAAQRASWTRILLGAATLYFIAFTLLARNPLALAVGVLTLGAIYLAIRYAGVDSPGVRFLLSFVAMSSCLYSLQDLLGLAQITLGLATVAGDMKSDAHRLAELTLIPAVVWAVGWGLVAIATLWGTIQIAWRSAAPAGEPAES